MEKPDLKIIPTEPGVYLYKNASGRILYVGKAKHLRKRVASYFTRGDALTPKTRAMLAQAVRVDTLCTATEKEALLLEAGLIKKHRPRYNIDLRDDKQYILFKLDKTTDYPRLVMTRRVVRDGSSYYGPFTSAAAARDAWKGLHRVFPLRRCKDSMFRNRVRPCLYHHMGQCLGPCVLPVGREAYGDMVRQVEAFLTGKTGELLKTLQSAMTGAAERMAFEEAARIRDQMAGIRKTLEHQAAVLPTPRDIDALGVAHVSGEGIHTEGVGMVLLFVRQGRLLDKKYFFWPGLDPSDMAEAVGGFVAQFYGPGRFVPEKVLLPTELEDKEGHVSVADWSGVMADALTELRGDTVRVGFPRGREERRLAEMARVNVHQDALASQRAGQNTLAQQLARRLQLDTPPRRIEAVDVAHTSGSQTRAGVVVFQDEKPLKEAYRVYGFDDLPGTARGDDYGVLRAWVHRRAASGPPWPDMLLIDGGKGQLAAVAAAWREALAEHAPFRPDLGREPRRTNAPLPQLASIAKERARSGRSMRHAGAVDRIFLPGRRNPANLPERSPELLFLQHVRDQVHRFTIGRHRAGRDKAAMGRGLLDLPGVGPRTARLLWDHFPSLDAMAAASIDELAALPGMGPKKAAKLHEALRGLKATANNKGPEATESGAMETGNTMRTQ